MSGGFLPHESAGARRSKDERLPARDMSGLGTALKPKTTVAGSHEDSVRQLFEDRIEGIAHLPHCLHEPGSSLGPALLVSDPDLVREVE